MRPPWPTSGRATSRTSSSRGKNHKYRLKEEFRRRCGTENTREKRSLRQAEICRGNSSRRGGNHRHRHHHRAGLHRDHHHHHLHQQHHHHHHLHLVPP